jgi:hypothetical protein
LVGWPAIWLVGELFGLTNYLFCCQFGCPVEWFVR